VRLKKNGERAIGRQEWEAMSLGVHHVLKDMISAIELLPPFTLKALEQAEQGKPLDHQSLQELLQITDTLIEAVKEANADAVGLAKLAKEVRRGRPVDARGKRKHHPMNMLAKYLMSDARPAKRAGRPKTTDEDHDALTYRAVEHMRKRLSSGGRLATRHAAYEALIVDLARDEKRSVSATRQEHYNRIKASYNRAQKRLKSAA